MGAPRGRPPLVTLDQIAEAVLQVGFPRLTFAAVRDRLKIGETTLYRHAPDRDALVRLGLDRAIGQVTWPELTGSWREILASYARASWHAFAAYPGSATETARGVVPSGMMRLMDGVGGALMRSGFTAQNSVLACDVVFDLVTDNRRGVEHFDALVPNAGPGRIQVREGWSGQHVQGADSVEAAALEEIHAAVYASIEMDPLEWFERKLAVVLAGVERELAP